MRYGYFHGPEWNWYPERKDRPQTNIHDRQKARDNSPRAVLREMGLVASLSLGVVLLIDIVVLLIEVPLKAFHFG